MQTYKEIRFTGPLRMTSGDPLPSFTLKPRISEFCFKITFLVDDIDENKQNIEEHVQPNIEDDNSIDMMGDFAMDDLNTEDMEALDAAEEKTLKADIKASIKVV